MSVRPLQLGYCRQFVLNRVCGKYFDIFAAQNQEYAENDMENLKDKVEDIKNQVTGKATEFAADAKDKAENFAGKTLDAAEKLLNDVFKKNKTKKQNLKKKPLTLKM